MVITELTTDEAVIAWNDGTIKDLHSQTWTSLDRFVTVFARYSFQVVNCNEFLRQTTDEISKRSRCYFESRNTTYRAEARF
jgi:hypothetical protein